MARGKSSDEQNKDPRTNKMEAVRQAMEALGGDPSPTAIQGYVRDNFGQEMTTNMISSYKSNVRSKAGLTSPRKKKRGRPKKTDSVVSHDAAPVSFHDVVPWKDLRTIKEMARRIGKKGLRELVELLD